MTLRALIAAALLCGCQEEPRYALVWKDTSDGLGRVDWMLVECDTLHDELVQAHDSKRLDRCANDVGVVAARVLLSAPPEKFLAGVYCPDLQRARHFANTHHPAWPEVERLINARCPEPPPSPRAPPPHG